VTKQILPAFPPQAVAAAREEMVGDTTLLYLPAEVAT
jgi:hypothetical protein